MEDKRLTNWTDERVALLKKLWASGLSASRCAAELGYVTRNAVIGKLDRLGLTGQRFGRRKVGRLEKVKRPTAAPKAANLAPVRTAERLSTAVGAQVQAINRLKRADGPKLVKEDFKARVADVVSRRVTILEVLAMECRWADEDRNEDGLPTFCGNPTDDGSSYCPAHAALAVGPGTASERAATSVLKREAA